LSHIKNNFNAFALVFYKNFCVKKLFMLAILSPAKTMKFDHQPEYLHPTQPFFSKEAQHLVKTLKNYDIPGLMKLMSISENLAKLNIERFDNFKGNGVDSEAVSALFAFRGDVYLGLNALSLNKKDVEKANQHLRILSGLYGLLKPSDLIEAYRLEMGTSLSVGKHKDLYSFWGSKVTSALQKSMEETQSEYLINLASNEYCQVLDPSVFGDRWINVEFKEMRAGKLKFITFNAKKARGSMSRFIIEKGAKKPEDLFTFDGGGYLYDDKGSSTGNLLFVKPE